jgi:hypothetical protein
MTSSFNPVLQLDFIPDFILDFVLPLPSFFALRHLNRYEAVWECRELMSWPLHRCRLAEVQEQLDEMDRNLIKYMLPFSKSGCKSEKHHQWAHYCFHRANTGCSAKEYAFERSYAVGHKKQVQFTNKSKTKALQTSAKHWFRNGVHRLAVHLDIHDPGEDDKPEYRTDNLENPGDPQDFKWTSANIGRIMRERENGLNYAMNLTKASTTLYITLKNRMTLPGKPDRLASMTLRANYFTKIKWVDDVRVQYRDDDDVPAVGFGKCMGFFGDAAQNNHVAIQWYKICGRLPINPIARMCKVELMESWDFIPVGAILNGALIVPIATEPQPGYPQQFWVLQSHREAVALDRLNA